MTTTNDTMNSKLNMSFSQLFQAPFGGKATEEEEPVKPTKPKKSSMDDRLSSRLSIPPGQTRSSRKHRINRHHKPKREGSMGNLSSSDRSTSQTGSPNSSASSIGNDLDIIDKMHSKKDEFDKLTSEWRRVSTKPKSSRGSPEQPKLSRGTSEQQATKAKQHASPEQAPKRRIPIRRTKSEGTSLMTAKMAETRSKQNTTSDNNNRPGRKSSMGLGKSPRPSSRKNIMADDSRKTIATTRTEMRRTGSSSRRSNPRRTSSRESLASSRQQRSVMSEDTWKTKESTSTKETVCSSQTNVTSMTTGSNSQMMSLPVGMMPWWTCECGNCLSDRMNFCGYCGIRRHWTCGDCQFDENLNGFSFCGNCGLAKGKEEEDVSDEVFFNSTKSPRSIPPKLVTMFE